MNIMKREFDIQIIVFQAVWLLELDERCPPTFMLAA
jgi:hypothetical protein